MHYRFKTKKYSGLSNRYAVFIAILIAMFSFSKKATAQQSKWKVRIAKIEVDSVYLDEYRIAVAEHARTAVRVEPGVLTLNAVYDKTHPTQVTVFEVYTSDSAYQAHIKTPHFLKYKNGTLKMVKSLQLIDVIPIELATRPL